MNEIWLTTLIIGIPGLIILVFLLSLMLTMKETTGEIKHFLRPDNLVKLFAMYLIVSGTILLSVLKIINGETAGVIFSGIIGYTLGTKFTSE
ncbi:MAG TPA: hypothetical protein VMR18_04290 [Candidatus Saccharimonadales bacterium]|nr:hypothetical protein [Candidatus Saccharimonadales bacterium]